MLFTNGMRWAWPVAAMFLVAAAGVRLVRQEPVDPCEIHPEIHACAMFRQPEGLARRVYAGRPAPSAQAVEPTILDTATVTGAILPHESGRAPTPDDLATAEGI